MAFDYTAISTIAFNLVSNFGKTVTFEKFSSALEDPAKPWLGPVDPRLTPDATAIVSAVAVEPDSTVQLGISTSDSDLVKRSEQILIVAPGPSFTEDLATFNEVIDGSIRWKITVVEKLRPANDTLLYFVGISR